MNLRRPTPDDAPALAELLDAIIAIGGTTAHQVPKTPAQMQHDYIDGPDVQTAILAEEAGRILGFQSIELYQGDSHIGTFVQPGLQARGIGAAMFAETCAQARAVGVTRIHAAIRADNVPGLAYYARMGFADYATDPGFALNDGRVVGRIFLAFDLV